MNRQEVSHLLSTFKYNQDGSRQECARIRDALSLVNEGELFDGLYSIAVSESGQSDLAASLLFDLNPACPLSCEEAIRRTLAGWNLSTQGVPCYLFRQFSKEEVEKVLAKLSELSLTKDERIRLSGIRYWFDLFMQPKAPTPEHSGFKVALIFAGMWPRPLQMLIRHLF